MSTEEEYKELSEKLRYGLELACLLYTSPSPRDA